MGHPISTHTKIGALIASTGEPVYMWSARARIAYSTLNDYICGRRPISHNHLIRLCDVFDVEPEQLIGLNDENAYNG